MGKPGDPALRVRRVDVRGVEHRLSKRGSTDAVVERQEVSADADQPEMAQGAAVLFPVLEDVPGCGQRMWPSGQVLPPAHEARPIHVNHGVEDVHVLRHQLKEERLVAQAEAPLVQVVPVGLAGIPASCRQID